MQEQPKLKARWFATILKEAETLTDRMPWQARKALRPAMIGPSGASGRKTA